MKKSNYLNLFYDKEADVLYFSKGTPSSSDISNEVNDEVVIRQNPITKEVTGFTILNFSKKSKEADKNILLPIEVDFKQTSFM